MGRRSGHDEGKASRIREILERHPDGIWVREIARQAGLDKSTVSIYINKHMKNEIEEVHAVKGALIKIVRLKQWEKKHAGKKSGSRSWPSLDMDNLAYA